MSDSISRQAATEGVKELFALGGCYCDEYAVVGMLNSLPSAEPGIIHCYDCVHYTGKDHPWGVCLIHRGSATNRLCQGIDYCSWAERRVRLETL